MRDVWSLRVVVFKSWILRDRPTFSDVAGFGLARGRANHPDARMQMPGPGTLRFGPDLSSSQKGKQLSTGLLLASISYIDFSILRPLSYTFRSSTGQSLGKREIARSGCVYHVNPYPNMALAPKWDKRPRSSLGGDLDVLDVSTTTTSTFPNPTALNSIALV